MRPTEYHRPFDVRSARRFLLRFGAAIVVLIAAFQSISFYWRVCSLRASASNRCTGIA